jgi:hypothetical protein
VGLLLCGGRRKKSALQGAFLYNPKLFKAARVYLAFGAAALAAAVGAGAATAELAAAEAAGAAAGAAGAFKLFKTLLTAASLLGAALLPW